MRDPKALGLTAIRTHYILLRTQDLRGLDAEADLLA
jgi:hypothetical protein